MREGTVARVPGRRLAPLLAAALIVVWGTVVAQAPPEGEGRSAGAVFPPPLADPKEPQFFAAYLLAHSSRLAPRLGAVGFGQTIDLVGGREWQLAIAAGVFSQFDMHRATTDLMNTDYLVGLPFTYRHGAVAARFQLYHQSSHLGDEYMVHTGAVRVPFSFEAADVLVAKDIGNWRVYGGGQYLFVHAPSDLRPGIAHGGVDYRAARPVVRFGRFATGRLIFGLDGKAIEDQAWRTAWSLVAGLELNDPLAAPGAGWRWSVLLKGYSGPAPYGQFYRDYVSSVGFALGVTL